MLLQLSARRIVSFRLRAAGFFMLLPMDLPEPGAV